MVRDDAKRKTIFWLIILLCVVIWFELIMVVKFFTKEFIEYTMEEDSKARVYYQELILANESKKALEPLKTTETDETVNDYKVEEQSNFIVEKAPKQTILEPTVKPTTVATQTVSSRASTPTTPKAINTSEKSETISNTNNVPNTYKGYATIGKIEIPKTNVNMPILANQTVGGMEVAACLLYSSGSLNNSGKTLITGHNYRNGKLFSNNNNLQVGDSIFITTLDGKKVEYVIYNKITTNPEDVSFLINKNEDMEIFLSSCTDDDINRIVIMAKQN